MREDKKAICDAFCEVLRMTTQLGYPDGNPLKELRYIKLDDYTEIVRPVFEDGTGENGWYDVNVSGDSGIAVIEDIVKRFVRRM